MKFGDISVVLEKGLPIFFLGSIREILPVLIEIHDVHLKKFSLMCLEEKTVFGPAIAHSYCYSLCSDYNYSIGS